MYAVGMVTFTRNPIDRAFVSRLKKREEKAFTRLVEENQDRVYTYLLRMLGNPYEASEVTQEVFIAAFRFIDSYRAEGSLTTWLLKIASNLYKNRIRHNVRRRRSLETSLDDVYEKASYRPIGQRPDNPENLVATAELEKAVEKAIAELPNDFREVLVLRDIQLMSYAHIQELLDLPEGTIKSRLHRARSMIGRALADHLEGGSI